MATKIARKTVVQFGGSLAASDNIAIFGAYAAGAATLYSLDPAVIQSLIQYLQGWTAAVFGNNAPAKQDRNALDYLFSYFSGYLHQAGIAEYDAGTYYFSPNSLCVEGGVVYICWNNPAGGLIGVDPATDVAGGSGGKGNFWQTLASTIAPAFNTTLLCKAWVKFAANGTAGLGIVAASNGTISLARNSQGVFTLTFPNGMFADANYTWAGSCMAANGGSPPSSGNNNHLIGGGLQTQTQLRIETWESAGSLGPEDCDYITIQLFGN